eukprot:4055005-Lingulodinium_polyedra.AAC.1
MSFCPAWLKRSIDVGLIPGSLSSDWRLALSLRAPPAGRIARRAALPKTLRQWRTGARPLLLRAGKRPVRGTTAAARAWQGEPHCGAAGYARL